MTPSPLIVTCTDHSDRRATPDLYTFQLVSPATFTTPREGRWPGFRWPDSEVWVINTRFGSPSSAFRVRCNGKLISFKRRPELRIPWAYGAPRTRHAAYGHFVSLDGETWDTTGYNYAPYIVLSFLPAADRRALARQAKKEAK